MTASDEATKTYREDSVRSKKDAFRSEVSTRAQGKSHFDTGWITEQAA
jgi:hypothetical protein